LAEEVKALVCQSMVEAMELLFPQVPIEVEAKVVANWGEK
jgi:DNA polymerase I-like protein with 3'-5' exonuclease and polymerase domains